MCKRRASRDMLQILLKLFYNMSDANGSYVGDFFLRYYQFK